MKHYKLNNDIFAFELDGSQDHLITKDMVEISLDEIAELNKPSDDQIALNRIAELRLLLTDSDFKVLPDYDQPNEEIKAQRQAWRDEIRALEK